MTHFSAWLRMNLRIPMELSRLFNRRRNSDCYRTSHRPATPVMSFRLPSNLLSRGSHREAESSTSIELFIFLLGRKCSFQFPTGLPTEKTLGLVDLWMQVDNLTKLWILCSYCRTPKNRSLFYSLRRVGVYTRCPVQPAPENAG